MPKFQQIMGDTDALRVVMADRLNMALARNPDIFRSDRGQLADFVKRYKVRRTVAHRTLTGETFPTPPMLLAISEDLNIPLSFFYGKSEYKELNDALATADTNIRVHGEPGFHITLPTSMIQTHFPERLVAVRLSSPSTAQFAGSGDLALVERVELPAQHKLHAVESSAASGVKLVMISSSLRGDTHSINEVGMPVETFASKELTFAGKSAPKGGIRVLGKVVGRIGFMADGYEFEALTA